MDFPFTRAWRRRALAGDREAVALLARDALPPLFQFCLYRVGKDRHLCEEVVQETLVRALRDLHRYEPERANNNVFPWLTGLARNEISRVLARDRRRLSLDELWSRLDRELLAVYERLEDEPLADEALLREETRELVNVTLSQLPSHYREALEAKYVRGASVHDLAELWHTTDKAVESLLTRARKAFRATFQALGRTLGPQAL